MPHSTDPGSGPLPTLPPSRPFCFHWRIDNATALSYIDVGISMPALERLRHLLVGLGVPLVLPLWSPMPHPPLPTDLRQGGGYLVMPMVVLMALMGQTGG